MSKEDAVFIKLGKSVCFQGDIMIEEFSGAIPKEAKLREDQIVAHSETGHHHVAENAAVFDAPDGMSIYLRAIGGNKTVNLVHKRNYDTHKTISLQAEEGKVFKITRQREHTPEGWRRVED